MIADALALVSAFLVLLWSMVDDITLQNIVNHISSLKGEVGKQFSGIEGQIGELQSQLTSIEGKLDALLQQVDANRHGPDSFACIGKARA